MRGATSSLGLARVSIGTVTALAAGSQPTVNNSGTAFGAILNFGIPAGPSGINATATAAATQSANGLMAAADKKKLDGQLRRTLTTDVNGLVTWTFNPPYAAGVVPVVEIAPQSNNPNLSINHRITTLTNTAVTVQLSASAAVTVLGISVLGVQQPGVLTVHLTAGEPTAA